jgi:hypothetical protein
MCIFGGLEDSGYNVAPWHRRHYKPNKIQLVIVIVTNSYSSSKRQHDRDLFHLSFGVLVCLFYIL